MKYKFQLTDRDLISKPWCKITDIPVIHSGYRNPTEPYIISAPVRVTSPANDQRPKLDILIPAGFKYDGASVPVFFRRLLPKTHPRMWRAATVHDWLYYNRGDMGNGVILNRKQCDDIFLDIMIQDGLDITRRNAAHQAVRMFGRGAWLDDD